MKSLFKRRDDPILESSRIMCVDLTREGLRRFLKLKEDWLPHWTTSVKVPLLPNHPIQEIVWTPDTVKGMGWHPDPRLYCVDSLFFDATRVIEVQGELLEAAVQVGYETRAKPVPIRSLFELRRYPNQVRRWWPQTCRIYVDGPLWVTYFYSREVREQDGLVYYHPIIGDEIIHHYPDAERSRFTITFDYKNLADMIVDAGIEWADPRVNDANCPAIKQGRVTLEFVISQSQESPKGFCPATLADVLALVAKHPNSVRYKPIMAYGSTLSDDNIPGVGVIRKGDHAGKRAVRLAPDQGFITEHMYRFAHVREIVAS